MSEKEIKQLKSTTNFLSTLSSNKGKSLWILEKLSCVLDKNNTFFTENWMDSDLSENLVLFFLYTLLKTLATTSVDDIAVCEAVYRLISLIVDLCITYCAELVNPCSRYLDLFVDLSEAVLSINAHSDTFCYPIKFLHFKYDVTKCFFLEQGEEYKPLMMNSNEDVFSLFAHSIRISTALHKLTRHFQYANPILYNMISVTQLWNAVAKEDIHISTALVALGTAVCLAEVSPIYPLHNTTVLAELEYLLVLLTSKPFHEQYQRNSASLVFPLFLEKVCEAMEVFQIAILELDLNGAIFINDLSSSFFSPIPFSLPVPVATVVSQLLHDLLLLYPVASYSTISLIDNWHRSDSLCHAPLLPVVIASCLYAYTHLRSTSVGYPQSTYSLLYAVALAHVDDISEYSVTTEPASLDKLNSDMIVLDVILESTLRLVYSCFSLKVSSSSEEISNYETKEIYEIGEVEDLCKVTSDALLTFSRTLCHQYQHLPSNVTSLLLKTGKCFASLICIYSSELFPTPLDQDYVIALFECMESIVMLSTYPFDESTVVTITRVLQVLPAAEKKPECLFRILDKLLLASSSSSPSPNLMLALTSSLPIFLKFLSDVNADKIADQYCELVRKCNVTEEPWMEFSLELAARVPTITALLSAPNTLKVGTFNPPSHHPAPLSSSIYTLHYRHDSGGCLSNLITQSQDFLKVIKTLYTTHKLPLSTQVAVITSLFDLSFILPPSNQFIPSLLRHIFMYSSYTLALLLTKPIDQLINRLHTCVSRESNLLDDTSLQHLVTSLDFVIYKASSSQKLLSIQCYQDLVYGLNKMSRVEEAITIIKKMLHCAFTDNQTFACEKIREILSRDREGEGGECGDLRARTFAAIPSFLASDVFEQQLNQENLTEYLNVLTTALNLNGIKELFKHMLCRLVQLIFKRDLSEEKKLQLLNFIADHAETTVSDILLRNFSNLYSDLFINSMEQKQMDRKFEFLKQHSTWLSGAQMEDDLFSKLALNIDKNYAGVNEGVNKYFSIAHPQTQPPKIEDLINTRFLSMLKCLEDLNNNTTEEQQLIFVKSLGKLIGLLDVKCISSAPHKLMASLTYFLQHRDERIVEASFSAWKTFTSHLALPSKDPIWIHIIVTLYQYMCEHKIGHKLIQFYSELIFKHKFSLDSSASYVYTAPLPVAPVYDELREKLVPDVGKTNHSPLIKRLEQMCKGLSHEALSVRKFVLDALLQLIESNISEISTLIFSGPFVDKVISNVIQTLARSFELKQERMNIQLTKCIGALGAVDPARLGIERQRQESSSLPICRDLTANSTCAISILTELTRYLATNTVQSEAQDFVCHAIQQVMTAYEIPNPQSGMRIRVEEQIDRHVWDVIQQYLDSRYLFISGDTSFVSDEELEHLDLRTLYPIYSTEITKTHHHWLSRFCKRLTSFIIQPSAKLLFQACVHLIAMIDTNIGYMLLPHIIIHIMLDDNFSENRRTQILDVVHREFDSVLNTAEAELNQTSRKPGAVTHLKMIVDIILNVLNFLSQLKNSPCVRLTREEVKVVESLSSKFPLLRLVSMSKYCNLFPLALRYLEQYIQEEEVCLEDRPDIRRRLGDLYELLEDRESILGLQAFRRELPSLEESILEQLHENNISAVVSYYKKGIQQQPHNLDLQLGLIQTQLEFGFEYDADLQLRNFRGEEGFEMNELLPYQLEACWKLSQWEEIDRSVRNPESGLLQLEVESYSNRPKADWRFGLGVLLNCAKRHDEIQFLKQLEGMRKQRSSLISSYSLKCVSNDECYQELVKLCMLRELEEGVRAFIFSRTENLTESQIELFSRWERSLLCTRKSFKTREPILSLRKAVLGMSCLTERHSLCILEIAKLSRRCGIRESGDAALSKLSNFEPNEPLWLLSNLEKAKFISKFGSGSLTKTASSASVEHLQKILSIAKTVTGIPAEIKDKWNSLLKKTQLYQYRCKLDQMYRDDSAIQKDLTKFVIESPHLDKALFTLAEFQFELASVKYEYSNSVSRNQSKFDMTLCTILNYFKLVRQNNKYVITSMPKAISFWLISAHQLFSKKDDPQFDQFFNSLNENVGDHYQDLQPYHLYSAFSVLLSNITGTDPETFKVLSKLIHYVYNQYPTICVWLMIPLINSQIPICRQRMDSIFKGIDISNLSSDRQNELNKVSDIAISITKLIEKFPLANVSKKSIYDHIFELSFWNKDLHRFQYPPGCPQLVVPIEYCFQFPIHSTNSSCDKLPTIQRFEDFCKCYSTKQRPHRFRIGASDGNTYDFLYKSEEDVRKDNRSMEIFMHMNLLMKKDPRCNERISFIRTFAVVPLGKTCGLIEWVENRTEIKDIILNLYETAEQPLRRSFLLRGFKKNPTIEVMIAYNNERLIKCSPPVFHRWFYNNFPSSTDWYLARQEYTRSVAVMSMGGYIMGLGDRHLQNMLICTQTGHVMHVDFGVLFGEGESLDYPETVPYRLTHNLVDGMGVLGYQGCFKNTCESTLRCFREGYQSLYPILRNIQSDFDILNTSKMDGVHSRLKGLCRGRLVPVEEQVQLTIEQATSHEALHRMFYGWLSFL